MGLTDTDGSFTELAMGQQPAQTTGLYAVFYPHAVQNETKSNEEGRPIYEDRDYIRIMVPGDKSSIIERPVRFGPTPMHDNNRFSREFALYKQGADEQLVGTPLSEWPVISRSQCKELEFFNVRTVEQLAEMPDTAAQNFVGVGQLREVAKRFIDQAKEGAPLIQMQAELSSRDDQIQALQDQLNELVSELKEQKGAKKKG